MLQIKCISLREKTKCKWLEDTGCYSENLFTVREANIQMWAMWGTLWHFLHWKFSAARQTICRIHVHAPVLLTGLYKQLRFSHLALYFHIFLSVMPDRIAGNQYQQFCVMNKQQFCGVSEHWNLTSSEPFWFMGKACNSQQRNHRHKVFCQVYLFSCRLFLSNPRWNSKSNTQMTKCTWYY